MKRNVISFSDFITEKKGVDHNDDGKVDSVDWKIARDKAIKQAMKDQKRMKSNSSEMEEMEEKIKKMKSCKSVKEWESCYTSIKENLEYENDDVMGDGEFGNTEESTKRTIYIEINKGLVSGVYSNMEAEDIEFVVVDLDNEMEEDSTSEKEWENLKDIELTEQDYSSFF